MCLSLLRVKRFLAELANEESEFARLRREEHELRASLASRGVALSASNRLTRDQLHERDAVH
jgi:hypothetical protein